MIATEGTMSLFRGITAPIINLTILNAITFANYGWAKDQIQYRTPLRWHHYYLAGAFVGAYSGVISTPFEMVKIQCQLAATQGSPLPTPNFNFVSSSGLI
jgi:hypothetical protein